MEPWLQILISLTPLTASIFYLGYSISNRGKDSKDIAQAIREQTKYFQSDDDCDDGDEWKRLIK